MARATTPVLIGVGLAVAGLAAWRWATRAAPPPPSPDRVVAVATTLPEPTSTTVPGTRRRKGAGLFGQPLAKTDDEAEDGDEDEDLPPPSALAAKHDRKEKHRRHGKDGEDRHGDRHALFSADLATDFPTPNQKTLDDLDRLDGETGSIVLWIQPLWLEHSQDDATLVRFGDDRLRLVKNVGFLRFEIVDRLGNQVGVGAPIASWVAGEWHHLAATWDGSVIALYVDGVRAMAAIQSAPIDVTADTPVFIGSSFPLGRPVAPAVMAGVTIRDRALTPMAIARRFASGPHPE